MDYQPTITVESKVLPGVRYTLHRTTAPRRARFQESVQEYRAQVREIQRQRKPLDEEYQKALDAALAVAKVEVDQLVAEGMTREDAEARVRVDIKLPDDKYTEWADSIEEQRRIEKYAIARATLRALFVGIEGFTIGGAVPTVDMLIDSGPDELADELAEAAERVMALKPSDSGNLQWPGTSEPAAAGPTSDSTAPLVESAPESA